MLAVAQLLHIRMPSSYEVAFPQSSGRASVGPGKEPDASNTGQCFSYIDLFVPGHYNIHIDCHKYPPPPAISSHV